MTGLLLWPDAAMPTRLSANKMAYSRTRGNLKQLVMPGRVLYIP